MIIELEYNILGYDILCIAKKQRVDDDEKVPNKRSDHLDDIYADSNRKQQRPILAEVKAKKLKIESLDEIKNQIMIKNEAPEIKIEFLQCLDSKSISTPDSTKFSKRGRPRDILTPDTSNYHCDLCDKNFSQQSGLWAHT